MDSDRESTQLWISVWTVIPCLICNLAGQPLERLAQAAWYRTAGLSSCDRLRDCSIASHSIWSSCAVISCIAASSLARLIQQAQGENFHGGKLLLQTVVKNLRHTFSLAVFRE